MSRIALNELPFFKADYISTLILLTAKTVAKFPSEQFPFTKSTLLFQRNFLLLSSGHKSKPSRTKMPGMYRRENKVGGYELPSKPSSRPAHRPPQDRTNRLLQHACKYLTTQHCYVLKDNNLYIHHSRNLKPLKPTD